MAKENIELLDFPEAIKHVIDGKSITKKDWDDESTFVFIGNSQLCIRKPGEKNNEFHPWMVHDSDLQGGDWYTL